jgi:multidrug resistance efflux pump
MYAVLAFTALLLLFGWIVKYPDTVTGFIKINSDVTSLKLVTAASGNIHLMPVGNQVTQGDYIAVIDNPARTEDIRAMAKLMNAFTPLDVNSLLSHYDCFPHRVSLGEVDSKYYSFLSALQALCEFRANNTYDKQRKTLEDDVEWKTQLLDEMGKLEEITAQKSELQTKWKERDQLLYEHEVLSEFNVDQTKAQYLTALQESQNMQKEMVSLRMQIAESRNRITQVETEKEDKRRDLLMNLTASFHDLTDNLKAWEQKYVFKAPIGGELERLKFIAENQFVQAGEEVFGIIPQESNVLGQMLLPTSGAGKVEIGSEVIIKLDSYPYMEYGSVEGRVKSISTLRHPQKAKDEEIETYSLIVDLPHGLKTNYGESLPFQYELSGNAEIIVNKRRLIERLFDNLQYRIKQ